MYSYTPIDLLLDYFSLLSYEEVFFLGSTIFLFDNASLVILCLQSFLPSTCVFIACQLCMHMLYFVVSVDYLLITYIPLLLC